jgi:hypothetical protein
VEVTPEVGRRKNRMLLRLVGGPLAGAGMPAPWGWPWWKLPDVVWVTRDASDHPVFLQPDKDLLNMIASRSVEGGLGWVSYRRSVRTPARSGEQDRGLALRLAGRSADCRMSRPGAGGGRGTGPGISDDLVRDALRSWFMVTGRWTADEKQRMRAALEARDEHAAVTALRGPQAPCTQADLDDMRAVREAYRLALKERRT